MINSVAMILLLILFATFQHYYRKELIPVLKPYIYRNEKSLLAIGSYHNFEMRPDYG